MWLHVATHIITLALHVSTHLVEARGRDELALAVDLPSDWREARANLVVAFSASGRASVLANVFAVLAVNNHATHQVWVVIAFVVDDGEDLRLHTNLHVGIEWIEVDNVVLAEDAIVKWRLVLVGGATGARSRVWPMNFISLTDFHALAVLPVVRCSELRIVLVVPVAPEALTDFVDFVDFVVQTPWGYITWASNNTAWPSGTFRTCAILVKLTH